MDTAAITRVKTFVLIGILELDDVVDRLYLKGGNALSLIYGLNKRPSLDLDFSMLDELSDAEIADISKRMHSSINQSLGKINLEIIDWEFKKQPAHPKTEYWGGYQIKFKMININLSAKGLDEKRRRSEVVGIKQTRKIEIDISKHEICEDSVTTSFEGYAIKVYSLRLIVIEKIRAICQQNNNSRLPTNKRQRARDFYDIYTILTFDKELHKSILEADSIDLLVKVFEKKEVPIEVLKNISEDYSLHEQGFSELQSTLPPAYRTYGFMEYFNYTKELMNAIYSILTGETDSTYC